MEVFLKAKEKKRYLVMGPPSDDKVFEEWEREDAQILTWLWNSMKSYASSNIMFKDFKRSVGCCEKDVLH